MIPLKVSQYADDTTLFLKNENDIKICISHLNNFAVFSNLVLNMNKYFALSVNGKYMDYCGPGIKFKSTIWEYRF